MRHGWTEEEIEFVREKYPYHTNQELVEMVFEKFGFKTTKSQLKNLKHKHKIHRKKIGIKDDCENINLGDHWSSLHIFAKEEVEDEN